MILKLRWLFACIVFAQWAHAQSCEFKAEVRDQQTGEPLPGAHVRVRNTQAGATTDLQGSVIIKLNVGDSLLITFVGYEDKLVVVDSTCLAVVRLKPSNKGLEGIVIQSERLIAEEFTYKKIRKLDIYTNPSAKADPILAVNSAPSATTTDESANISLRGSSPAETGIFLNNVPINDAVRYSQLNGIGTFSIFNTALVNNVQLYPGNPPLEFGNTTSGLIALQTDEGVPSKPVNTLSVTLASIGLYTNRKISKRSSITAFSNYQPSAMIKALNKEALKYVTAFNSIDLGIHYYQKLGDKTVLKVFTYGIRESYQFYYRQPTYQGNFHQYKVRDFTIANLRTRFRNAELSFNTSASFSFAHYYMSTINIDLRMRDFYSSLNYQYFGRSYELKGGLSYDYRQTSFAGKYPLYGYAIGEQYPLDSGEARQDSKLPEAFFYAKYFPGKRWVLGTGLRKNIAVDDQSSFVSGQVNLNFRPHKALSMNLAAGKYNKSQLPQGEGASLFHIGAEQYSFDLALTKPRLECSASVFYKKSKYLETHATVKGLEFYTKYRFSPAFRGQVSITSLSASLDNNGTIAPSPYDIAYFLRGNLEYKFGGTWTMTMVYLFRQGSYYIPVSNAAYDPALRVYEPTYGAASRLPGYNIIDLSISKIFMVDECSSIAFVGIGNAANFRNVRGYSYNFDYTQAEPDLFSLRTFYLGWILTF